MCVSRRTSSFDQPFLFFQNCNLGQHLPLEGGVGEGGVVLLSSHSDTTAGGSATADPDTNTRHCE